MLEVAPEYIAAAQVPLIQLATSSLHGIDLLAKPNKFLIF